MAVSHYSNRGVHGQVVDLLGRRIMVGELPSGSSLDPEELMVESGVSRTVIREVLKVLAAKGLVDARPRRGTFVTERSSWHLIDADVMRWRSMDELDPHLMSELSEVREIIEPAACFRAAERRTGRQLAAIAVAMEHLDAATSATEHAEADLDFHRAILEASGNELLLQMEVILEPALHARDEVAFEHAHDRVYLDLHRSVMDAIADQDSERAAACMTDLIQKSRADFEQIPVKAPKAQRIRTS